MYILEDHKVVFEHGLYKVVIQKTPGVKVVDLLKSTFWGTNGTLYQHKNTEQNISYMIDPLFFSLEKKGELIGTCCFSKRKTGATERTYDALYSRYFSIVQQKQGGIFGKMILKHIKTYFEQTIDKPTVLYAYVDQANIRSYKLLKHIGFESIRSFETLAFSRIYPKVDKRVSRIKAADKDALLTMLHNQYKEYTLVNFDRLFFKDDYFVLKVEDEIVAGIRANVAEWTIRQLPGVSGKLIVNFLPYIPFLSRLFNPGNFRFSAFEGVYCKIGYEKELFLLMESVCGLLKIQTGMMWLDKESELYLRLKNGGDWGIMNRIKDDIPAYVVAAFKNIPEDEKEIFRKYPVYISAFDLI